MRVWLAALFVAALDAAAASAPPPKLTTQTIALPGPPFGVVATRNQKSVFVSLAGRRNGQPLGIAVLRGENGRFPVARVVPTPSPATGIVLTQDERHLIAAGGDCVMLLSVERLVHGDGDPVAARINYDDRAGSVYVNCTADDRTLFVSDEQAATITVIDLEKVRARGFDTKAVLARIDVGIAPIALTFSPDGRWLYTTSQRAPAAWGWPKTVRREATADAPAQMVPPGAVIVLEVERARIDPSNAIVARVPAGGSPVRLAVSPDGARVYVATRNDHALRVFDTAKLRANATDACVATIPVGSNPVPVLVVGGGRTVLVGNSNRFGAAPDAPSTLSVISTDALASGGHAVIGSAPVGAFPRELHLAADGHTVFLTNFRSHSLMVFDAGSLDAR